MVTGAETVAAEQTCLARSVLHPDTKRHAAQPAIKMIWDRLVIVKTRELKYDWDRVRPMNLP